ncbi:MAG: hypothetical protein II397_06275, partial [Treponema sp.]|nr:hypothetical protein [Treponema sp.]
MQKKARQALEGPAKGGLPKAMEAKAETPQAPHTRHKGQQKKCPGMQIQVPPKKLKFPKTTLFPQEVPLPCPFFP